MWLHFWQNAVPCKTHIQKRIEELINYINIAFPCLVIELNKSKFAYVSSFVSRLIYFNLVIICLISVARDQGNFISKKGKIIYIHNVSCFCTSSTICTQDTRVISRGLRRQNPLLQAVILFGVQPPSNVKARLH